MKIFYLVLETCQNCLYFILKQEVYKELGRVEKKMCKKLDRVGTCEPSLKDPVINLPCINWTPFSTHNEEFIGEERGKNLL